MTTYAVIDFETTGLSPALGDRPTEIAAVVVCNNRIVDRFQSLMNPGVPIPYHIQNLTGITNAMVRSAPPVAEVMAEAARFVAGHAIVAHNAAFDRKFWSHSTRGLAGDEAAEFICSLLLSRRIFPASQNHKLGTLVSALGLPKSGQAHRALSDAECTAHLLIRLVDELQRQYPWLEATEPGLLLAIQRSNIRQLEPCIRKYMRRAESQRSEGSSIALAVAEAS